MPARRRSNWRSPNSILIFTSIRDTNSIRGITNGLPGLTVTLPVLNQNRGPIAEAEAKRAEAAASFNALQAHVIGEIERAVAAYRVTLQKSKDAEDLQENLKKQEKRAQAMLEAGEISRSELAALRLQLERVGS